jgi:biotin carboxylase
MARVLLLLPTATFRASDFLAAARRLGAEAVVATDHRPVLAPGSETVVVDFARPARAAGVLVDALRHRPVDAVVAVDGPGVELAAVVGERLGLRHNPPRAARAATDKAAQRRAWAAAGIPQPAFVVLAPDDLDGPVDAHDLGGRAAWVCDSDDDRVAAHGQDRASHDRDGSAHDRDLAAAVQDIVGMPCVVKPAGRSGSCGVVRVDDPATLPDALRRVRAIVAAVGGPADGGPLLVERYVTGPEVAVEALHVGGRLEVLAVFDKPETPSGPAFPETMLVTPSRLPATVQVDLADVTRRAVGALGLCHGPVHAEFRLEGSPFAPVAQPLEVHARPIGGLCGRVLRFGGDDPTGLEDLILRAALGLPLTEGPAGLTARTAGARGVCMLYPPSAGRLRHVAGLDAARAVPGIDDVQVAPVGTAVAVPPEAQSYVGHLFARAPTPGEVEFALRTARSALTIEVDP